MKITAIAHSKHRNAFGLVGIEVDSNQKRAYVKMAKQWSRDKINTVPSEIAKLYREIKWSKTYIDQESGEHLIQDLRKSYNIPLKIITTQKKVKDPKGIEKITTMDKIEITQFMLTLMQNHQVKFPQNPSQIMAELEHQIAVYSEHKTEQGSIDYFAPGEEKDNLTKALLICCFAARKQLSLVPNDTVHVGGGIGNKVTQYNFRDMHESSTMQEFANL
ncbi:MAG: hypothetical protein IS860_08030 [Nitrosopumilus sp.]|nr:hypothetical protein [Nitrosopumilus sp.]